jgi:hypothetical protein
MICLIAFYPVPTEKYNEMNPTLLAYHHHAVMPISHTKNQAYPTFFSGYHI